MGAHRGHDGSTQRTSWEGTEAFMWGTKALPCRPDEVLQPVAWRAAFFIAVRVHRERAPALTSTFSGSTPWRSKSSKAPSRSCLVTRELKRATTTPNFILGLAVMSPMYVEAARALRPPGAATLRRVAKLPL
eukprot:scaffold114384_cov21-Tisochrysis_lutea.AAC.2